MKRILVLLSLFVCLDRARAELLIQRTSETVRLTGESSERTLAFSGFNLREIDGTNGAAIRTITGGGRKFYEVSRSSTPVFSTTVPGHGRTWRVIALGNTQTNESSSVKVDGLLVKGVNSALPVSASREFSYPRVLRGNFHRVDFSEGEYRVSETKTTRIYSQTETSQANARGEDVETALARIVQRLEASGYQLP